MYIIMHYRRRNSLLRSQWNPRTFYLYLRTINYLLILYYNYYNNNNCLWGFPELFPKQILNRITWFFFQYSKVTWLSDSRMSVSLNLDAMYLTLISEWLSSNGEKSPLFLYGDFLQWILVFSLIKFLIYFTFIFPLYI